MELKIVTYPDSVLRKKAEEVKEITPDIKQLALAMIETMKKEQGIGLAAPQIGQSKRIIVAHLIGERSQKTKPRRPNGSGLRPQASEEECRPQIFINPKITKKSRQAAIYEEGCLSFPGLFLKIKRAEEVEVEALDENGKEIKIKTQGLPARIFQHEIDHLDGILFIDRIPFLQKLKMKKNKNYPH